MESSLLPQHVEYLKCLISETDAPTQIFFSSVASPSYLLNGRKERASMVDFRMNIDTMEQSRLLVSVWSFYGREISRNEFLLQTSPPLSPEGLKELGDCTDYHPVDPEFTELGLVEYGKYDDLPVGMERFRSECKNEWSAERDPELKWPHNRDEGLEMLRFFLNAAMRAQNKDAQIGRGR